MNAQSGKLVIVSGPSGAGKTTVVQRLVQRCPLPLQLSISATTRPQRPGEVDGKDYFFLSNDEFQRRRAAGEFLECFEVYGRGYWYGTPRQTTLEGLQQGRWVVLEIDVQGMQAVVAQYPQAITFFVRPPSLEELERRLRGRGTEAEDVIQRRLQAARQEWEAASKYDYDIVNFDLDQTAQQICDILCDLAE